MNRARTSATIAAFCVAGLVGWGCGPRDDRGAAGTAGRADVTPAVRQAAAVQRDLLAAPAPAAPAEAVVRRFYGIREAVNDPDRRVAVADSFFAVWERDPRQALWVELAVTKGYLLQQKARRERMLDQAAGTDTAGAWYQFVKGRRIWGRDPAGATEAFRRAAALDEGGDPLFTVWARLRWARLECDAGDVELGTGIIAGLVPLAWETGGATLAGTCWQDLGLLARRSGRLGDALVAGQMALLCADRAGSQFLTVWAQLALGQAHLALREYATADSVFVSCAALARTGGFVRWERDAVGLRAGVARSVGATDREIALLEQGVAMARAGVDTNGIVRFGASLVNALQRRGDLAAALARSDEFDAVNALWRNGDYGPDLRKVKGALFNQLGRYAAAESLWTMDLGRVDAIRGPAGNIDRLVHLIRQGLETDRADVSYRALARARELLAAGAQATPNYDPELQVAAAAARLHARQGEHELAAAALRTVADRAAALTPESAWYLAEAQAQAADLAGDELRAREALARCAELADEVGDPDLQRQSRVRLGAVLIAAGDCAAAAALAARDRDAPEYWTRLNARLLAGMAEACAGRPEAALEAFAAAGDLLGPDAPADFAARLGLERGRALAALQRRAEAYAVLLQVRGDLARSGLRATTDVGEAFNRGIVREVAEALIGLLHDEPKLAGGDAAASVGRGLAAWARRAQVPAPRGPRIEYFLGAERSFAWVADPGRDGGFRWGELPPSQELLALANAVTTDLGYPGRDIDTGTLESLATALLAPLAGCWPAGEVLEIVPDGALGALPWSALPWPPGSGTPALEHGPLVLAVGRSPGSTAAPGSRAGLLAIGADDVADRSGGPLHLAEAEARAVAALWTDGPAELLLGSAGGRTDLLAATAAPRRAIHIASHARVFEGVDGHSAIYVGGADAVPLTLPELAAGSLSADLVYLSSCEGGRRHRSAGRGVVSFAEAFLGAGADEVVASSVLIDDAAALRLAGLFYREWLDGKDRADALRSALLAVRAADPRWEHPYYWAFLYLYR